MKRIISAGGGDMKRIIVATFAAGMLAGCGSTAPSPATSPDPSVPPSPTTTATGRPTKAVTYSSGAAQVSTTGAEQVVFDAPLDPTRGATYSPGDGFDLWWKNGDQALNVSGDVDSGEVDAFVRVETVPGNGNAYVDSWHTLCDVTLSQYDDEGIAGTFTCKDLPSFSDGDKTVDAQGTFSATA